ncbi:MAG: hypothetical protein ACRERX_00200 [Pseudomonas sp.]
MTKDYPFKCNAQHINHVDEGRKAMSKGLDSKKAAKKKPAKTLDEKRAMKKAKKAGGGPFNQ